MNRKSMMLFASAGLLAVLTWVAQRVGDTRLGGDGLHVIADDLDVRGTGAGIGLLLLGSWFVGKAFKSVKLPKITGFLIFGMLMGPSLLGIIRKDELDNLRLVNDLAVSLIALAAGGEIRFSFLRRALKTVATIVVAQVVLVIIASSAMGWAMMRYGGFMPALEGSDLAWMGLILGTIATAGSPAVVIAVINEARASGAFPQLALSATVVKDVALIVLFTVVIGIAAPAILSSAGGAGATDAANGGSLWGQLAWPLLGSIAFGSIVGVLFAGYARLGGAHLAVAITLASFAIALLSRALGFEALLVALVAGVLMRNVWESTSEPVFESVERLSLPVYCVFFAVAGAKVQLGVLAEAWYWALAFVVVRAVMVSIGATIGAGAGGQPSEIRRWMWTPFISQAGVAVALAGVVLKTFADLEGVQTLFTLLLATIAINELIGPIIWKIGLERVGESDGDGASEHGSAAQSEPGESPTGNESAPDP